MPSTSKAQQHAMGAALGGAKFPLAKALRASMTMSQLRDFASTKTKGLPSHAKPVKPPTKRQERKLTQSSY